jgi:hypothetical protein
MRHKPLDVTAGNRTGLVRLAAIFSNIVSPPSIFAAAGFVLALIEYPLVEGLALAAAYGLLASLIPVLYVVYLLKKGHVSDIHMSDPRERRIPYLIGLLGVGAAFLLVRTWGGASLLSTLIFCHLITMAELTLINLFYLISNHVTSVTALFVFTGLAFGFTSSLLILPLVLLTLYVRWFLKRHTIGELLSGLLVGSGSILLLAAFGVFPS